MVLHRPSEPAALTGEVTLATQATSPPKLVVQAHTRSASAKLLACWYAKEGDGKGVQRLAECDHQSLAARFAGLLIAHVRIDHCVGNVFVACPLVNRVHVRVLCRHCGTQRVPQDVRMGMVRCDSDGQRVLAKQPKKLHPGHGSALL
jgi:hypothetical protein